MTRAEFLATTNERKRERVFTAEDYLRFSLAVRRAKYARKKGRSFYANDDKGGVCKSYGYTTTTAQWGVYVDPDTHKIVIDVRRMTIYGPHVGCIYPGGESAYTMAFNMQTALNDVMNYLEEV